MRCRKSWLLIICILGSALGAFAQDAPYGESLVMRPGQSVAILTGLPADQRVATTPSYPPDFKEAWLAIDNESYQYAWDLFNLFQYPSVDGAAQETLSNEYRLWLSGQPGLPDNPAYYFQGKYEDIAGNPTNPMTPAYYMGLYGQMFLREYFCVDDPATFSVSKRYPRWEGSGTLGLRVEASAGRLVITAGPDEDYPIDPFYPVPDYYSTARAEEVCYLTGPGQVMVRLAVTVVPSSIQLDSFELPLVYAHGQYGHSVPTSLGTASLIIPAGYPEAVFPSYSLRARQAQSLLYRAPSHSSGGPSKIPLWLRDPVTPGYVPTRAGIVEERWNPPDGGMALSPDYPKWVKKGVIALPHNEAVEITKRGINWTRTDNKGLAVKVPVPIGKVPTFAQIKSDLSNQAQLLLNGETGYYASGPVWYDERKYYYFKEKYVWESFQTGPGSYAWKLRWSQHWSRVALERIYNKTAWNGSDNKIRVPFIGSLFGWYNSEWRRIDPIWGKPRWVYKRVPWPIDSDGIRMIKWVGQSQFYPDGIQPGPQQSPPRPIIRQR